MTVRIVIAEDNLIAREGILSLLALDEDLELVAVCADLDELLAAVAEHGPDVVITDIRMPPTQTNEGLRAAATLREEHPDVGVVVLSQYVEPDYALELLGEGSAGRAYLLKERIADEGELSRAVKAVAEGGSVVDPRVVDALIESRTTGRPSVLDRLTDREMEVLAEVAAGRSNAAIGEALYISPRSVEKHINSIFTKLDLVQTDESHRRVQAVLLYLRDHGG